MENIHGLFDLLERISQSMKSAKSELRS